MLINQPAHYLSLFSDFPPNVEVATNANRQELLPPYDLIHFFTTAKANLEARLPRLRELITQNGTIWVSWPKGKSAIPKDLNENHIRDCMLANGMVDVKVCAVDEDWSGLKGVIPVDKRK